MKPARIEQLKQIVADNYQEIAEQFSATRQKPLWPRLRQILRQLPISGRLLDIGCGNGRLLEELKKRPIDCYVGLDSSPELLKIAAQGYPQAAWPFSINWQLGNLLDTPTGQQFDFVCCIAALHHLPGRANRQLAAKNLGRWLKPGGYLIISVWDLWHQPKYWPKLLTGLWLSLSGQLDCGDLLFNWGQQKSSGRQRYYHAFTKAELKRLIVATGLDIVDCQQDGLNLYLVARQPIKS